MPARTRKTPGQLQAELRASLRLYDDQKEDGLAKHFMNDHRKEIVALLRQYFDALDDAPNEQVAAALAFLSTTPKKLVSMYESMSKECPVYLVRPDFDFNGETMENLEALCNHMRLEHDLIHISPSKRNVGGQTECGIVFNK